MKVLITLALLSTLGPGAGPRTPAVHKLKDGTLIAGTARTARGQVRIETVFGVHVVGKDDYAGKTGTQVADLQRRFKEMVKGVRKRDSRENQAIAQWCLKQGYLEGLRKQLNRLLTREIDHVWARDVVAKLAARFTVNKHEEGTKGRDRRRFVAHLFEVEALRDNVGAVIAVEKARGLDKDLTFRAASKALRGTKPRMRWAGAKVLADHRSNPLRISPLFKRSLSDGIWAVRREAVRALKVTDDPKFVQLYAKHLRSPKDMIRVRAAQNLAELGLKEAVAPLIAALADTWRPVRTNIAVTRQTAYVKDYDVEVAQTAFIADPVVDVIQDGAVLDVAVINTYEERRLYRDALHRVTGVSLGDRPSAWRKWLEGAGKIPNK